MNVVARRALVAAGVAGSIAGGGLSVALAADWSQAHPTPVAPAPNDLLAALATEQDRSATLASHVEELQARIAELTTALDGTSTQAELDSATASDLRAQLSKAQGQVRTLEARIAALRAAAAQQAAAARQAAAAAARPSPAARAAPTAHATTGASGASGGEVERDGHDDD